MMIEIKKKTSTDKVRSILRRTGKKRKPRLSSFFGKLPKIEDGLKYQKKVRHEWE